MVKGGNYAVNDCKATVIPCVVSSLHTEEKGGRELVGA